MDVLCFLMCFLSLFFGCFSVFYVFVCAFYVNVFYVFMFLSKIFLGNERFIATGTALQIALVQPSDSGKYFCVVRNTYTNQTRRSPRPLILIVEPINDYYKKLNRKQSFQDQILLPQIVFPLESNRSIIEMHVVVGQTVLMECVMWNAKILWNKSDFTLKPITMTDERARIRQLWGNLRIKQVIVFGLIL